MKPRKCLHGICVIMAMEKLDERENNIKVKT